jgi:signal transduction histidine kinase
MEARARGGDRLALAAPYAVASAAVGVALVIDLWITPVAAISPFPFLLTAVMASAWYGGLGPSLLATALATLAIDYFFEVPYYSLAIANWDAAVKLGAFLIAALLISALSENLRRARQDAEVAAERVRELERFQARQALAGERSRIAREMHDGLAKSLTGLALEARTLEQLLSRAGSPATGKVAYLAELSQHLAQEARDLIYDVRMKTGSGDLVEQLRLLLADWQAHTGIAADLIVCHALAPLSLLMEYEILRIVEESLTNTQRHAHATRVTVEVAVRPDQLEIMVCDDGAGFAWRGDWQRLARSGHFGLLGMRERAIHLGGTLEVNGAPHEGVRICLRVPFPPSREDLPAD